MPPEHSGCYGNGVFSPHVNVALCYGRVPSMKMRDNGWRLRLAAGLLIALVSLISFAEFLPHTDDGCEVESHCVACRAHMAAFADLIKSVVLVAGVETFSHSIAIDDQIAIDGDARLLPEGRAPPGIA